MEFLSVVESTRRVWMVAGKSSFVRFESTEALYFESSVKFASFKSSSKSASGCEGDEKSNYEKREAEADLREEMG